MIFLFANIEKEKVGDMAVSADGKELERLPLMAWELIVPLIIPLLLLGLIFFWFHQFVCSASCMPSWTKRNITGYMGCFGYVPPTWEVWLQKRRKR